MNTQKFFSVVKASRHFIAPSIVLILVLILWVSILLLNLLEKTIEAAIWSCETLTASYVDMPPLPQEDTLLDDTIAKLKELSIRELKKVASIAKLPRYGRLTKDELIADLLAHHGQDIEALLSHHGQ
jgi:hypothetical protein